MHLVQCHEFTRLTDIRIAKEYLIGDGHHNLAVVEDYHEGTCCGKGSSDGRSLILKPVRQVYYGRIRGVDICDECLAIEKEFLDGLIAFDETKEFAFDGGKSFNEVRNQDQAFEELKRKDKLSKDEKRRKELELQGQGRLF